MHLEAQLRIFEAELRQHRRQKVRHRRAIGINGDPAALKPLQVIDQLVHMVEFAQRLAGAGSQQFPAAVSFTPRLERSTKGEPK